MLNKSGENGYHCLVFDLRGEAFYLSPFNMMLALGYLQMLIMRLKESSSIPTVLRYFIMNGS